LQDDNVEPGQAIPFVDELARSGIRVKQLYAQYGHTYPGAVGGDDEERRQAAKMHRADYAEMLLRWFERELKGLDVDTGAPAQVADDLGRWRNEAHYPPHDATWTTWHLSDGVLADAPGARERVALGVRILPVVYCDWNDDLLRRTDSFAEFVLPARDADLLIVGLPRVHVAVTPEMGSTALHARLCERAPDGSVRDLGRASMNLAYADGTRERREVVPGVTLQAKMEIHPIDAGVRAGHELVLRLWIDAGDEGRLPATLELGHDIPSVLHLSTIERGPEVYFDPPRPA
jgi:predicted acyl esterase